MENQKNETTDRMHSFTITNLERFILSAKFYSGIFTSSLYLAAFTQILVAVAIPAWFHLKL